MPSHNPLDRLHQLRSDFSTPASAEKLAALKLLASTKLTRSSHLQRFHDDLQFLAAFPPSPELAAAATDALHGFAQRLREAPPGVRRRLADTGIAGTTSRHTYMHGAARWLVARQQQASIAWAHARDAEGLDLLIRRRLLAAEEDAFDDAGLTSAEWLRTLSTPLPGGPLQWIVGDLPDDEERLQRMLYDDAEVPVSWDMGDSPWSTSRNRAPVDAPVLRSSFRRLPPDPVALVRSPLRGIRVLREDEARPWLDASLAALIARCREVAPTTYANADEVYLADLGEGATLCIIGVAADERLALEANYGYVMFANGVPVGYGGVTPLANQANTGANIFEAFRGSEAPLLFAQSLRAFRTLFGISRFVVNPYQFGAGNDEALQSGAYWFYDRLGFRAASPDIARLANAERKRLAANRKARTPLKTLRQLATSDLVLELDSVAAVPLFPEGHLATVGLHVARRLATVPGAQRATFTLDLARDQKRQLTGSEAPLSAAERRGALRLSPILALIDSAFGRWSPNDRKALWAIVRAKGGKREALAARLARVHAPFWNALRAVLET